MTSFKKSFPLQKRIDEAVYIMKKYPDRVPVIIEKDDLTIELDDCNILEKLYSKYGYKLLIEKLNEINK